MNAERQAEVLKEFQELLMEADNFPRGADPSDYRKFWTGLRGKGSSLLGLTRFLGDQLNMAVEVINKLEEEMKEEKKNGTS